MVLRYLQGCPNKAWAQRFVPKKELGNESILQDKALKAIAKPNNLGFVILSGAKNLVFSVSYRSFTTFRMTEKDVLQELLDSLIAAPPQNDS
jgi:hypothetical protein